MHQHAWGEDPQWALYRHRERLEFTDPPVATPPPRRHIDVLRGVPVAVAALALIAALHADTTATATTRGVHHGTDRPPTSSAPHHSTLPQHTKEAQR